MRKQNDKEDSPNQTKLHSKSGYFGVVIYYYVNLPMCKNYCRSIL